MRQVLRPVRSKKGHYSPEWRPTKFSSFPMFYNFVRRAFCAFSFSIFFGSTEDQA
jgi:hypothetical protein